MLGCHIGLVLVAPKGLKTRVCRCVLAFHCNQYRKHRRDITTTKPIHNNAAATDVLYSIYLLIFIQCHNITAAALCYQAKQTKCVIQ